MKTLTNSMRTKYQKCPMAYKFAYVDLRRPANDTEALSFGTSMHSLLEAWWTGRTPATNLVFETLAMEPYQKMTALALIRGYDRMYSGQPHKTLFVERTYSAPLLNPETTGKSLTWELGGKLDGGAEIDGRMLIVEHKTTSEDISPASDYWPRLVLDGQVSGYYLGAQSLGFDPYGCLYDVIRKPTIKPYKATPEESRKYKADGTLYANQRDRDETPEEWLERLELDIAERPEYYFARKEVQRTSDDMLGYVMDMWIVGRNIAESEKRSWWPRHTCSCKGFGYCEYFPVCSKMADLNDDRLFVTTTPNPEL